MPATPQISLVGEHCSYLGAYCKSSNFGQEPTTLDISKDSHETNNSRFQTGLSGNSFFAHSSFQKSTSVSGVIKGLCPGLTHRQKFGISYVASPDSTPVDYSSSQSDRSVAQSHSIVVLSDSIANNGPKDNQVYPDNDHEPSKGEGSENDSPR